jgi:hypothetical protein
MPASFGCIPGRNTSAIAALLINVSMLPIIITFENADFILHLLFAISVL